MSKEKTVIILSGPTAAGKTRLAIEIAKKYNTEIISADSRQCFQELRIGVARPSEEELSMVPHHFIASHSIKENITAAFFEQYALAKAEALFRLHDTVVMVGGTGLYIKAFCKGLDQIPEVKPEIRQQIMDEYNDKGMSWLQEEVRSQDPLFFQQGENQNPQRLMRALEIKRATGQSILSFRTNRSASRNFRTIKIALDLPREQLHANIHQRVDKMMEEGLEDEVRSLVPFQHLNALQTVGYKELFDHFNGKISLTEAVEEIKKHTRQYAKRQLTWFRNQEGFVWLPPEGILDYLV